MSLANANMHARSVAAVWLIVPHTHRVYCFDSPTAVRVLTRGDDLTGDAVVPGFRMPVAELFPFAAEPTP